jgi:hypothetical protein
MLQPVNLRQPASTHRPTISYLSTPPAIPAVIASQPAAQDSAGPSPQPTPKPPELLLSPRLLSCPPELSTVLPPLDSDQDNLTSDVTSDVTVDKCLAATRPLAASRTSALSFSYSQLLASLEDSYSDSNSLVSPPEHAEVPQQPEAPNDIRAGAAGGCDCDDEYMLLDLRPEPEVEYVVLECECHSTVHYWRPHGPARPIRCYGTCGRVLAAPGPLPGTLRLQRTDLLYYYQYRRNKKKSKM